MLKSGDRIKCIDNEHYNLHLDKNKTYVFVKYFDYDKDLIIVEDIDDCAFLEERFILDPIYYRKEKLKNINEDKQNNR